MLENDQVTLRGATPEDIVHFHRAKRTNDDGITLHGGIPENCVLCEAAKMRRFVFDCQQAGTPDTSETDTLCYGVEWQPGGPCDLYSRTAQTTSHYPSIEAMRQEHHHDQVVFLD